MFRDTPVLALGVSRLGARLLGSLVLSAVVTFIRGFQAGLAPKAAPRAHAYGCSSLVDAWAADSGGKCAGPDGIGPARGLLHD